MNINRAMLVGVSGLVLNGAVLARLGQVQRSTSTNPDGLSAVNGDFYRTAIPLGGLGAKQPAVGEAGEITSATFGASRAALSAEFTGLITTQEVRSTPSSNIIPADQCLKN